MIRKFFRSFGHAGKGILDAFSKGGNIYVHTSIAMATILLGAFLHISPGEWCTVLLCIGIVISAEIMNTALEYFTDMVSPALSEDVRKVKDTSAGAVLVVAIVSFVIALIIFVPKILNLLQ